MTNEFKELVTVRNHLIEEIDKLDDLSDMWQIGARDGLHQGVVQLDSRIKELSKEASARIKTRVKDNSKSYLHSYTKKEQNTTEEAVNDDKVNKPNHYVGVKGLEVEEVLQNFLPKYKDPYTSHRVGSAIEYQLRSPEKNGLEDLRKARKNLDQAIEYEESKVEHNDTHSISAGVSITADNLKLTQDPFETNWEEARQNYDTNLKDVLESFVRVGYDMEAEAEAEAEGIKAVELI